MIPPAIPKYLTLPSPSITPEAFMDTAVVNGTAFPYVNLPPDAVRFRILDAGNDRSLNLQLYSAAVGPALSPSAAAAQRMPIASTIVRGGVVTGISVLSPGAGCTAGLTATITDVAGHAPTTVATATPIGMQADAVTGFTITNPGRRLPCRHDMQRSSRHLPHRPRVTPGKISAQKSRWSPPQ